MNQAQADELVTNLQPFIALKEQWDSIILGGSMALIIQKAINYRTSTDIDLVGHCYYAFKGQKLVHQTGSDDDVNCHTISINERQYDYFVNPKVIYENVEFQGIQLRVQSPKQIMEAKLVYFHKYGIPKHRLDIINYFDIITNGYKEKPVIVSNSEDDDLPF